MIVNTVAQYTRTILNVCLSLYSTRLILAALGQNDYGIYSVVGGVVALLSFVTNALVTTTQRYLSFQHGRKDEDKLSLIFGNSMLLHIFMGVGLCMILLLLGYPIVYHGLNIIPERLNAAWGVFSIVSIMLLVSFLTAPLRALFVARENIVYISIIDICDGILKFAFAFALFYVTYDRLICYALIMLGIQLFNFFAFAIYAGIKFPECHCPRLNELDKTYLKEMSSFTGWTIYSSSCVVVRNQGIAIVLNLFFGTLVNAAYGIAQQVSGAVSFISSSIITAMNPQIMKAEGAGKREQMIHIAEYESKYAFLLLAMVSIPLILEMDSILHVWLTEVPMYAVSFCQLVLLAALCDTLTIGLTSANQAVGDIKVYTLYFYSIKLLTLVGVWFCCYLDLSPAVVLWSFVIVEFLDSFVRLPLLKKQINISIKHFFSKVLFRIIMPTLAIVVISVLSVLFIKVPYRFLLTLLLATVGGMITMWFTALETQEKQIIYSFISTICKR
ncbi:MAG: lipopolysaccharide biosynthesis protein [Paludibacteraceae bacterium]